MYLSEALKTTQREREWTHVSLVIDCIFPVRSSGKRPLFHIASGASHSPGCLQEIPAKSHFGKPARRAPLYLSFRGTEGRSKTMCQPEPGSQAGRGLCNVVSARRVHSGHRWCRSGPAAKAHFPGRSPLHETTYFYSLVVIFLQITLTAH